MYLGIIEHLTRDHVPGRELTVLVSNSLFGEGRGNIAGSLDLDGFIPTAMEDPYPDTLEMRDVFDVGSSCKRYGSGEEVGALVDEMPHSVSAKRKSCQVDPLGIRRLSFPEEILEK